MAEPTTYEIEHISRYLYDGPVRNSVMSLCLKPRSEAGQHLLNFRIATHPPAAINGENDSFGNERHVLNVHREHESLEIAARSTVQTAPPPTLPDSLGAGAWEEIQSWGRSFHHWDYTQWSMFARPSPALSAFVDEHGLTLPGADPLSAILHLSDTLHGAFSYVPGSTSAVSPIEEILQSGRGVCQDYAHVMIAICRLWGIPSRYVSGYLHVANRGRRSAMSQASHAWVECLLPDLGWVGFDPTNLTPADESHVRVAVGRDYRDVTPTYGVFRGTASARLEVAVTIEPAKVASLIT